MVVLANDGRCLIQNLLVEKHCMGSRKNYKNVLKQMSAFKL